MNILELSDRIYHFENKQGITCMQAYFIIDVG